MKLHSQKILLICLCLLAWGADAVAKSGRVKETVDWPSFMARQDMAWNVLPCHWYDAAYLGNGMLGLMIYKESQANYIRLETGRSDVHDHRPGTGLLNTPRLLTGHFRLCPQGEITGGTMRVDLWNAEATAHIATTRGNIRLRSYVHALQMVIVTDIEADEGERNYRMEWVPADAQSPRYLFSKTPASWFKVDDYEPNPPAKVTANTSVQKLNAGGETVVAWEKRQKNGKQTYFLTLTHSFPGLTAEGEAQQHLKEALNTGEKKLQSTHRAWWHNYYPQSFLSLPDAQKENFYWVQMYKLASATRSDRALIDLCGPWPAVTPWPNTWWNLNVQLTYWPLNAANRLDLAVPLETAIYGHTENLKKNLPEAYRHNSMGLGRTSNFECRSAEVGIPGKDTNPEVGLLTWTCHNLWLIYRHKMDDTLLREKLFPVLKASVNYYLHFLYRGKDGKLHLPATYSPEYGSAPDCNFDLMILDWGCRTLIDICHRLKMDDPLLPAWKRILRDLVPYPVEEGRGWMIGRGVPYTRSHRHFSHLLAAYPFHTVNKENPGEARLIKETLDHWQSKKAGHRGYSHTGGALISAALGLGNDAYTYLDKFFHHLGEENYMSVNTLYRESGPCFETPMSGVQCIHDMLLQSWGGKIRIFPAMPHAWPDAAYRDLRAEGAFLVAASRKQGRTEFFSVKSLAGEPCVVVTDIANPAFSGKRRFHVTPLGDNTYRIDLRKGEEVLVCPQGANPDFTVKAMEYEGGNSFGKKS